MLRVIHGTAEIVALLISLGVYAVALSTKRYRLLGYVALASIATWAAMSGIDALIDRDAPTVVNQLLAGTKLGDATLNGVVQLSQLSAMFIVVRPFVGRQWRRTGIVTITLLVIVELLVATELPVDLFLALPVGAMIGTAILLVFGRPDRHPTLRRDRRQPATTPVFLSPRCTRPRSMPAARRPTSPHSPTALGCSSRCSGVRSVLRTCSSVSTGSSG